MNHDNSGYHVYGIERNNRTVKERYHAQYRRLPFQNIPKVLIRYFAVEVVIKLNYFTVKGCLSPYYISLTFVYQKSLYHKMHLNVPFGAFVQEKNHNNPKHSIFLRTVDGICLQSLDKI